jgi:large subunit GTPase 1
LQSVTEEDSFQEFLRKAELAGTEFQAEKLNIQFVSSKSQAGLLTETEKTAVKKLIDDNKQMLRIPRRPAWTKDTSADELKVNENRSFLEWRRDLALLQEKEELVLTPYEKNLEFWRQLWRVIERSDVVIQIVDSRNPLLFRCEDLEKYVKEVDANKQNVLLLNKADFLTDEQRRIWAEYFDNQKIKIAFFSALEPESEEARAESDDESSNEVSEEDESDDETSDKDESDEKEETKLTVDEIKEKAAEIEKNLDEAEKLLEKVSFKKEVEPQEFHEIKNNSKILTRQELIDFFKEIRETHPSAKDTITIGLTGYPNVGKSSTINALLQEKKVSVSATPGKTKHFQTLFLDKELILCDCCGLVLPSFCFTKAEMILNGILPIDQMRDHVPAVNTLCTLIPRHVLEDTYGILITKPLEGEEPNRPPHSEELLLAYGYNRGFMTANGQPDQSRSARRVLKDFVNGKLLYCTAPPTHEQNEFHTFPERQKDVLDVQKLPPRQQRAMKLVTGVTSKDIDDLFFNSTDSQAHIKGRNVMNFKAPVIGAQQVGMGSSSSLSSGISKPWKGQKREKREKMRRKFAHLDQH